MNKITKYTLDDITDEHLIDFIYGEISDQNLNDFIKNSPILKVKLDSYKNTKNLLGELEPLIDEDMNLDNYNHIIDDEMSTNNLNEGLNWLDKIKISVDSALLSQSPAFYGLAATVFIAVGLYLNIQNPASEWQARFNAMGFDSQLIDSDDWYKTTNEEMIYEMPNTNSNELTSNIISPSFTSDDPSNVVASDSDKEIINITTLDIELTNIDARLTSEFLTGVLHDMNSKKIVSAQLSRLQKKAITVNLYGKNSLKKECILGEINYEYDTVLSSTINSKFFNFCVIDISNPIQMIN